MADLRKIERGNLSEQVYAVIRDTLIEGKYEPGARLRINPLAAELGVSITPVREAIFRLVSEHALEMKAATAVHVRNLTSAELQEILLMRHLLEGEAASLAAERMTAEEVSALEALQDQFRAAAAVDPQQAAALNRQFHFGLVAGARMPLIFATVETMWVLMGPLLRTFHMTVPVRDLTSGTHQHYAVLRALKARDGQAAKAAIQADIAWSQVLVDWLAAKTL